MTSTTLRDDPVCRSAGSASRPHFDELAADLDRALALHRSGRQQQALRQVSVLACAVGQRRDLPLTLLLELIWLRKRILIAMQ